MTRFKHILVFKKENNLPSALVKLLGEFKLKSVEEIENKTTEHDRHCNNI